eukprot:scaffold12399_cov114-Skeletonema_dohrnii-CCMP3373.AAC.1
MKFHLNKLLFVFSAASKSAFFADAQIATVCESLQPYSYDSGKTKAATTVVSIDKAPWIQLDLSDSELADGATLTLVGEKASQVITSDSISSNQFSAVFDGNSISVELSTPGSVRGNGKNKSRVVVSNVKVGLCGDGHIAESICGDRDDRVPSTDVRTGRMSSGCTAWLISEDVFVQAGHCGTPSSSTRLHFTFGSAAAAPEDQYGVDLSSYQFQNSGTGNDWGAGKLLPNSVTGKLPGVAQSEKCGSPGCGWFNIGPVPSSTSGNNIRITGYGKAAVDSRTQKTHTGALTTIGSDYMRYVSDTTGGNSGSPVIHEETGYAVGVHTHGGCFATSGSNIGTRIDQPTFAAHVKSLCASCTLQPTPSPTPQPTQPTPSPTPQPTQRTPPPTPSPTNPTKACEGSDPYTCGCDVVKQNDYRGDISTTADGYTCMNWESQSPHSHTRTAANYPGMGLGNHNYCRNPDGEPRAWCYTTDPNKRWSVCDVPSCTPPSTPSPTSPPTPSTPPPTPSTPPPTPSPTPPTPSPTPQPTPSTPPPTPSPTSPPTPSTPPPTPSPTPQPNPSTPPPTPSPTPQPTPSTPPPTP